MTKKKTVLKVLFYSKFISMYLNRIDTRKRVAILPHILQHFLANLENRPKFRPMAEKSHV